MERMITAHFVRTPLNLGVIHAAFKADFELIDQERTVLQYKLGDDAFMHVFAVGVVTFFGVPDDHIPTLVGRIRDADPGDDDGGAIESEQYMVIVDPDATEAVDFEYIRIADTDPEKIRLISEALAQSMMLDLMEQRIDSMLTRFERLHARLAKTGRLDARTRNIMRMLGNNGSIVHFVVTKLSFLDKPDITWEEKEYELLFTRLRKEFELDERFRALKFRLEFVQDSSELALEMLSTRRSELLEVVIILLIALEVAFYLFGLW